MDHLRTRNVFIDTQAYVQARFDWNGRELSKILELAKARTIRLLTTSVTQREVYAHIDQRLWDATDALKKHAALSTQSGISLDKLNAGAARAAFDSFLKDAHAFDVKLQLGIDQLLDDYFAKRPPFGDASKRKAEFPDAIVGASLLAWCSAPTGTPAYVVTGDRGLQSFCEANADRLYHLPSIGVFLSHAATTDEIVQSIAAQLKASERFKELVTRQLSSATAATRDAGAPRGDLVGAYGKVDKVNNVKVTNVYVLDARGTKFECDVEFFADLTLSLNVQVWGEDEAPYEHSLFYDVDERFTAFATVLFDPDKRALEDISSAMVPANHVVLDPYDLTRRFGQLR